MKKTLSGVVTAALVLLLALADVVAGSTDLPAAAALQTPEITLNGTVAEGDAGYLNSKSIILSSGAETKVNYRLVPGYASGAATGVRVTINLPSLEYVGGEYRVIDRDQAPSALGVQGRVSAGGGWNVVSHTTVQGGPIVMEYDGDLGAGVNPAFDIFLTTYGDGTDGPYGGVPEGTTFEINGSISYEMFNRVEGASWETPGQLDDESRVSVISSDLRWDSAIAAHVPGGGSDLVPIWDRYQYVDYLYTLTNTSENLASNIDGYSVTFDIDSTDSNVNGIIPFDLNRWVYREGGSPTENENSDDTDGRFIGVPGEGGVLIYDVTDWDGESELTEEIPYTYSGTGMIVIDREHGADRQALTPEGAAGPTERKYLLSLPLSRQGFPNPPTKFKVRAITNVLFAKTANWSKTRVVEREIALPRYEFSFTHATKQPDVVYGYETYNEITDIRSGSNAPTFRPTIRYRVDDEFVLDRVSYEVPTADLARLTRAGVTYTVIEESGEANTATLSRYESTENAETGVTTLTFDLAFLNELEWDRTLTIGLVDRVEADATLPVGIKVYGSPQRVGPMAATATAVFVEKIASNDDFGKNTTYTDVAHETAIDTNFTVIYPKEVAPRVEVRVDGKPNQATVPYGTVSVIDFGFGVNDTTAANSTTTLTLNGSTEALRNATLTLRAALFAQAENVRASYTTLDGETGEFDLTGYPGDGDITITLPKRIETVVIDTDALTSSGAVNFASVSALVGSGLAKRHEVTADIRTYQPKPYDKNATRSAAGIIDIRLPNELRPTVNAVGIYGSLRTSDVTNVGYEAPFEVEYQLDTGGVNSPSSEYVIDMLTPGKGGSLVFKRIALREAYLGNVTQARITVVDAAGNEEVFTGTEVAAADVALDDIAKIVISGADLSLQGLQAIAVVEYDADIEMGSSQAVRVTFTGTQETPYVDDKTATKTNRITVRETRTGVKVEGVNQVTKPLGVGSEYSVDIYRWWNRGYTYNTEDFTLDQGYKSLGGFTSTLTRPTATYDNNDQRLTATVDLPHEHFDLYYVKIREEMRPYVQSVDIYRMVDGEEVLWRSVAGSDWVDNTQEGAGYWRIGTARPDAADAALYATYDSVAGVNNHPCYKDAWDADVQPEAPVSRVDVKLEFTREGTDAAPQMAGTHNDVIEYMGRFYASSVTGKKSTILATTDTFGTKVELTRSAQTSIGSLVAYPYAQTRTGANDNTSLANKVITMGSVGEYLASIWNVNTASWSYYSGHGPDVYTPKATEYDEWLGMHDPASFHDELVYEFVYPASPNDDAVYNLAARHITIADTSTLRYLTGLRVRDEKGGEVAIHFDEPLTAAARFDYDHTLERGIHDDGDGTFSISFGEAGGYPEKFEAVFAQVGGFGERTAEIDGAAADTLGASLAEVDVRVGGVVNGNKALRGTTNLFRVPADTRTKTLMHTSSATLTGYTPKLGARLDMSFDALKVYDYAADGVTPNTTRAAVGIENSSEADIKDFVVNVRPDSAFRTQLLEIPAEVFAGDWSVASLTLTQGARNISVSADEFVFNPDTGNYELDLRELFADGTLTTQETPVALGGAATLLKQHVDTVAVAFVPKDASVGLWGSLSRAESESPLPTRMLDGGAVFLSGVWVDEDADGSNWNSKPSFVTERSKGSNEQIMHHSSFTASATITSYNPISTSAGGGNSGAAPTLTQSSASNGAAPRLFTRVARMNLLATHLQNDFSSAVGADLFYDADTGTQISATNIAVGDTAKVLYELRNIGQVAGDDAGPGSLPVFGPVAHIEAPAGLQISAVHASSEYLLSDGNREALIRGSGSTAITVSADQVTINTLNSKRTDVAFDLALGDAESVFVLVEYTAINDFGGGLGATQGKSLQWNAYARPDYAHHFMSYDSVGVAGDRVTGQTAAVNFDGDGFAEQLGRVTNAQYRYADPKQLVIESRFDTENVSGQEMTLTVKNIRNEALHDNTRLDLYLTLDTGNLGAFELTSFPAPAYPEGFAGEFAAPRVSFWGGEGWIGASEFDPERHALRDINRLRVEYGTVPGLAAAAAFELPSFTIDGLGHWKTAGAASTKSYDITSQAQILLAHQDAGGQAVAEYSYRHAATQRVWKAIPTVEFNIQSFDTLADARAPYVGSAVGKTNYRAGDAVHYRLTAKNLSSNQGTGTNTPYGKAPLRNPVLFDKIPEYLHTELMAYVSDGVLDVEAAISAGALELRIIGADGTPRDFAVPTVTVRSETGLDIAGSQQFANNRHNDGWGRLSSAEPTNTSVNPAREIHFDVFTYSFGADDLGRGEQLEIIYSAQARHADLPIATYADGRAVFAPLYGWYGSNRPVANSARGVSMDMASLLHDAGITGDRGHEMTAAEFLSSSSSWQPGANEQRRDASDSSASYTQATFYDASADTEKSHQAFLRETAGNDLYTLFSSTTLDENFRFASQGRVNDGGVTADDRILWAQDGMQLSRAWLYGASEMLPDVERQAFGTDAANFYEHDGSLNSYNRHRLGYTPYVEDDYTYAVQLGEQFTVRLHAANLGDSAIEGGLEYTEILPAGVSPYDASGELLGVTAFDGAGYPIESSVTIVQTPENDQGYRAPAQSQEAGTYAEATRDDLLPYVVRIRVANPVPGMFGAAVLAPGIDEKSQRVDVRVRVAEEVPPSADGISYWHDEFTLTTIADEPYLEIYSKEYGAFNRGIGSSNTWRYPNDGMAQGIDVTDLVYDFGYYSSYFSIEPWGRYVRGRNAQATATTESDKPALVTGDQIAMRKPTLRVWSAATKDEDDYSGVYDRSIENFSVDLHEEFAITSTVENQQLEVLGEYNRVNSGYNRYSGDNYNDDVWVNAPQTIGGARGSWFEPTVSIALPYGVAPVMRDGSYARYDSDLAAVQDVVFTATANAITFDKATPARDLSEFFEATVERVDDASGPRFVIHFTATADSQTAIAYGESLVVSPRVVTIDTPATGADTDDSRYREVYTLANTSRPVFNPVVSARYTTGSAPSLAARDQGASAAPNNVKSSNGRSITANDRTRLDSTSVWGSNAGRLKITERLISATAAYTAGSPIAVNSVAGSTRPAGDLLPAGLAARHDKSGAYGGTILNLKHPSIVNTARVANDAGGAEQKLAQVDAAGTYWYATEVSNEAKPHANPYEEIKTTGDIVNSRFLLTQYVTNFAVATGEVRIRVGDAVFDRAEFEALGYSVERVTPRTTAADAGRNRIQWIVTTPENVRGTAGLLESGSKFSMLYQVRLVDGYEDNLVDGTTAWSDDELVVDSYVSVITDDVTLINGGQRVEDFIVQSPKSMLYRQAHASDVGSDSDIDDDGELASVYAADTAEVEILKPRAEVRVNTTRPRIAYSNGLSGDTYFNSSDTIEYLVTAARVTGSGLKEFVVEQVLPTHETRESTVPTSNRDITTTTLYVSSGAWQLPQSTLDRLAADRKSIDEVFRTYVYVSSELAEDGYEGGNWQLLNPAGTSILDNRRFDIPGAERVGLQKVRVAVKSLDPENYLVPRGLRLDVDADPLAEGTQEVTETDPTNQSTQQYPETVTGRAIAVGLRVTSDAKSTLFITDTAQAWGNYVGSSVSKLDQSQTRSYLTPSRPVVNVTYDALYYRSDTTRPVDERFGWSDVTAIAPKSSPHLKFRGEITNADASMWSRAEDNTYAADTLVNPFVTFQLPTVMESGGDFTYVPADEITAEHPLSDEHRSRYSLTNKDNNLWTWRLVRADGSPAHEDSHLTHTAIYAGPWVGFDRNVVSVWFDGIVYPGDKIVVEFIGSVDAYSPGADAEDLKSRALVTNNTGLLQPLNSQQNSANRLGYSTDSSDFNRNALLNDRLVFSEKSLFQYETYDNFGKRKVAFSDLNRAGTVAPESTPVSEGGTFSFEVSVDNSKERTQRPYPYPIIYDVLPFAGDTSITNAGIARGSQHSAWLQPDGMRLEVEGADKKVYQPSEYTVYVGPFTKRDGKIVETDMVPHALAGTEAFYDALGIPGQASATRDAYFVTLDEVAADAAMLTRAKSLLVLFNKATEELPGQNKLTFTYSMQAPLNAPAYLEQFDEEGKKGEASLWNSFMATQRVSRFIPQESNNAGVFVTQQEGKAYLGNYVWNDVDYDGRQNEGTPFTDSNGRTLLDPTNDLNFDGVADDPGLNGVTVTLLTPAGYNVDAAGNPIHRVGNRWQIVDERTGASVLDEVFSQPIESEGPLTTVTQTDVHGHAGYYAFSNFQPGEYRVMFEFPHAYDRYSATTASVFERARGEDTLSTRVEAFAPGEVVDIPAAADHSALVVITDTATLDAESSDAERMSFDIGIAQKVRVGGTIFQENLSTLDGYQGAGEAGLAGYHVALKEPSGKTARDAHGDPLVARTDAQGRYVFDLLPVHRQYWAEVTDQNDEFNAETVVTPFVHSTDPFARADDNDGLSPKGSRVVKTNVMGFDLEGLFRTAFADRLSASVGFYDKTTYGVIGNRVWNDVDRDGVQDEGEPGVEGQRLRLEQYIRVEGEWIRTDFGQTPDTAAAATAISNADGYYYFTKVPSRRTQGSGADQTSFTTAYQVVVDRLATGYTFTVPNADGATDEVDSDFFPNGRMHRGGVGSHVVSVADEDEVSGVVFGRDDTTVDLGLVAHARAALSGEVFIDADADGLRNDEAPVEHSVTATLQVRSGGEWVTARQDADGRMIEPAFAQPTDAQMRLEGATGYRFEQLHIIDSVALTPYEYRVEVSGIPLWLDTTALRIGEDPTIDSDFSHVARGIANTAVSEPVILGTLQNQLLPIDTFSGVAAEHVDLGLVPLPTEATIGDLLWIDQDGDGVQGDGEAGAEDARVSGIEIVLNRLVDGVLVRVDSTETDARGAYEFTVPVADTDPASPTFNRPHAYVVEFNLTSRQSLAPLRAGGNGELDSDFVMLGSGASAVYLHGIADPAHTAITDPVTVVEADANGYARYDTASATAGIDGGLIVHDMIRVLGDTLFDDVNRDGVQQDGEPGIPGLRVNLYRLNPATGLWEPHTDTTGRASAATGADGTYEFAVEVADLDKASATYRQAEQYRVLAEAPANLRLVEGSGMFTTPRVANVDGVEIAKPFSFVLSGPVSLVDSDDAGVILTSARDERGVDAGFAVFDTAVTIGGRVWEDADLDGLQGEGAEQGGAKIGGTAADGAESGGATDGAADGGTERAAEPGIAGRTVALWERIDGVWTPIEDLNGNATAVTAEDGSYRFEVSPTHYAEGEPGFLQPREYRVTTLREGYQVWSPLHIGDDRARDSDIAAAAEELGSLHAGATGAFGIVDLAGADAVAAMALPEGSVDVATVRDDVQMDIGLRTLVHEAEVGGTVWDDANQDGAEQPGEAPIAGQPVTLWERVDGQWIVVEDLRGRSTVTTDERGRYAFTVSPTHYDEGSESYLQPREYRTAIAVPQGFRLSDGADAVTLSGHLVYSSSATILSVDDEGVVDLGSVVGDVSLGFPFARVPADDALAWTGLGFGTGLLVPVLVLLVGLGVVSVRRGRADRAPVQE